MLVDTAEIRIKAGDGGDGHVSFRRAKFITRGGPDGGDGGDGGDLYVEASTNMATLMDFHAKHEFKAPNGMPGMKKKMSGKNGEDMVIKMPLGTQIFEVLEGSERLIGDLDEPGKRILLGRGGKGGKGNFRFRSSTNLTPLQYIPGEKGDAKHIRLEMKLIADIGLIGMPNAGKSTLINRMTGTSAKIGSYPFTTLYPNLGILRLKGDRDVIVADIPGLVEGAAQGKGLGDDFLRHVERTRILVHLVSPYDIFTETENNVGKKMDPKIVKDAYDKIRNELGLYSEGLLHKPEIVLITKMDVTEVKESFEEIKSLFAESGIEVLGISAQTGEGIDSLVVSIMKNIDKLPRQKFEPAKIVKKYGLKDLKNKRMVFRKSDVQIFEMGSK